MYKCYINRIPSISLNQRIVHESHANQIFMNICKNTSTFVILPKKLICSELRSKLSQRIRCTSGIVCIESMIFKQCWKFVKDVRFLFWRKFVFEVFIHKISMFYAYCGWNRITCSILLNLYANVVKLNLKCTCHLFHELPIKECLCLKSNKDDEGHTLQNFSSMRSRNSSVSLLKCYLYYI